MRIIPAIILLSFTAFGSCNITGERVVGNGKMASEERRIGNSPKIKVTSGIDVVLTTGANLVKVEGEENIIPYVVVDNDDGWLKIHFRDNVNINTHQPLKVYLSTPNIRSIRVDGSGKVTCEKKIASDKGMDVGISGSGDADLQVNAPAVNVKISGSGNLNISGETKDALIKLTGSGNYNGSGLKAETADVSVSGSGDAEVFADVRLKARVSGSGNMRYSGNAELEKHVTGSGVVEKMQ